MRINKFFSEQGIMSRRAADKAIADGRVQINGSMANPGDQVEPDDLVTLDGKKIESKISERVVLAYNKPVGIECTADRSNPQNIIDAIGYKERIYPVGRLDQMSEGLILLTNMGDLANQLMKAGVHEKEYLVKLSDEITDDQIQTLASGVDIAPGRTAPCKIDRVGSNEILVTLTQGLNRQIRRMVEVVDLQVRRLKRVRVGTISLGNLKSGETRALTEEEIQSLGKKAES